MFKINLELNKLTINLLLEYKSLFHSLTNYKRLVHSFSCVNHIFSQFIAIYLEVQSRFLEIVNDICILEVSITKILQLKISQNLNLKNNFFLEFLTFCPCHFYQNKHFSTDKMPFCKSNKSEKNDRKTNE